jgi:xanthine dehydrogenase molybdopterin-binding subunit B
VFVIVVFHHLYMTVNRLLFLRSSYLMLFAIDVQIAVYKEDGTVTVCHTGVEIGQGINTKIAQTVASQLGIDLSFIRVVQTSTQRIANGGSTGGSSTSEVCCQAAINACNVLNARLLSTKKAHPDLVWPDLLGRVSSEVSLNADGWYSPKGNPNGNMFQYFVWGACVTEVELDVLTGMVHVLSSEIVYDCGKSLNPAVDVGQIAGGFVMAMGYYLQEGVSYAPDGSLQTVGTWEYKPPLAQDIPSVFNLTLLRGTPNTSGILRSKAVGEPCIVLANSVFFAVKMAISAARVDAGLTRFIDVEAPMSIDVRQQACVVEPRRLQMPF